jgi:hypothetical protein
MNRLMTERLTKRSLDKEGGCSEAPQIEGTQSYLPDPLLYELGGASSIAIDDVVEVPNHVAVLDYGIKRLAEGFPLSNRLLREMRTVLLVSSRGGEMEVEEAHELADVNRPGKL